MNREEVQRLTDLARRLGSTPRRVLVRAARMVEQTEPDAVDSMRQLHFQGVRYCPTTDDCATLLLTPAASYALDSLESALKLLWLDTPQDVG